MLAKYSGRGRVRRGAGDQIGDRDKLNSDVENLGRQNEKQLAGLRGQSWRERDRRLNCK